MAGDTDLKEFVHERFRRVDEKLDKMMELLIETRQAVSGVVQLLASQDAHMLRMEMRLTKIEKRLDLHDPVISG